jgi:chromosomal replication initiation ATPase DnaA
MYKDQLTIEMPKRSALSREDFMVNECNHEAIQFIDTFYQGKMKSGVLIGPKGSGKSHLVNVFCKNFEKERWLISQKGDKNIYKIFQENNMIIIEDIDLISSVEEEEYLFHSINLSKELNKVLLLTSGVNLSDIIIKTPDLRSRLDSIQSVKILEPNDDLMNALILKLFHDRQILIKPNIISYLMQRIERSYLGISSIVDLIDNVSLSKHKSISKNLIKELLK